MYAYIVPGGGGAAVAPSDTGGVIILSLVVVDSNGVSGQTLGLLLVLGGHAPDIATTVPVTTVTQLRYYYGKYILYTSIYGSNFRGGIVLKKPVTFIAHFDHELLHFL